LDKFVVNLTKKVSSSILANFFLLTEKEAEAPKSTANFCLRRPETFQANVIGHLSLVIGGGEKT